MDRSDQRPADEPTYLDALLLMALDYAESRGLRDAYALIDGLERIIIEPEEWEHACDVLGRRGLIVTGEKYPAITVAGRALLMNYSVRLSRPVAHQIAEDLKSMQGICDRAVPPSIEHQELAVAAYRGSFGRSIDMTPATEGE